MEQLAQILRLLGLAVAVVVTFLRLHIPTRLGLGTGQVVFTTVVVGITVWLAGLPAVAAFVIGAVLVQSSTTISRPGCSGLGLQTRAQ